MTDLIEKFKGRYGSADNVLFPNSKYIAQLLWAIVDFNLFMLIYISFKWEIS